MDLAAWDVAPKPTVLSDRLSALDSSEGDQIASGKNLNPSTPLEQSRRVPVWCQGKRRNSISGLFSAGSEPCLITF